MRKNHKLGARLLSIVLMCLLIFTTGINPTMAGTARATTMRLEKTSGTVGLKSINGTSIKISSGMRLYSGNTLSTGSNSTAYVSLDSTKAVRLDANTTAAVSQKSNQLELMVKRGKLFFNVSKPLAVNASMNIRTSTTVTGVRGTSGVVDVISYIKSRLLLLEGEVTYTVEDPITNLRKKVTLHGGEIFTITGQKDGTYKYEVDKAEVQDIPKFAIDEVAADPQLQEKIKDTTDLDVDAMLEYHETGKVPEEIAKDGEKNTEKDTTKDTTTSPYGGTSGYSSTTPTPSNTSSDSSQSGSDQEKKDDNGSTAKEDNGNTKKEDDNKSGIVIPEVESDQMFFIKDASPTVTQISEAFNNYQMVILPNNTVLSIGENENLTIGQDKILLLGKGSKILVQSGANMRVEHNAIISWGEMGEDNEEASSEETSNEEARYGTLIVAGENADFMNMGLISLKEIHIADNSAFTTATESILECESLDVSSGAKFENMNDNNATYVKCKQVDVSGQATSFVNNGTFKSVDLNVKECAVLDNESGIMMSDKLQVDESSAFKNNSYAAFEELVVNGSYLDTKKAGLYTKKACANEEISKKELFCGNNTNGIGHCYVPGWDEITGNYIISNDNISTLMVLSDVTSWKMLHSAIVSDANIIMEGINLDLGENELQLDNENGHAVFENCNVTGCGTVLFRMLDRSVSMGLTGTKECTFENTNPDGGYVIAFDENERGSIVWEATNLKMKSKNSNMVIQGVTVGNDGELDISEWNSESGESGLVLWEGRTLAFKQEDDGYSITVKTENATS